MKAGKLVLAFAPLLVFTVAGHLAGPDEVGWAALASAVIAAILVLTGLKQGVKLITAASTVTFGALALIAFLGDSSFVDHFGTGICALVLGALMLASVRRVPFTEQYARDEVPREQWSSPAFRAVNARISRAWAGAVLGVGACRLIYGLIEAASDDGVGPVLRIGVAWVLPVLLVVAAVRTTAKVAAGAQPTGS